MTAQWSRAHDALIARVAEGKDVFMADVDCHGPQGAHPFYRDGDRVVLVADYSRHLESAVRAAEAWRKQDERARYWSLSTPFRTQSNGRILDSGVRCFRAEFRCDSSLSEWRDELNESLAWALWRACGGESDVKAT